MSPATCSPSRGWCSRCSDGLVLLLALFALKPFVTALRLGSGASGGLFTPTLSTGAVLVGAAGIAWPWSWS
jgi:chloride channel protein, CIC family